MPHTLAKSGHLTTAEAAALLGVSVATLKRWAQSGLLPSERTEGGHRRYRLEDVRALAEPAARAEDPVRRGADLVLESGDALGLQGWLLQARRDLGSWWGVATPLRAVAAELYRRRAAGALGAVHLEMALDRLRTALLRFLETSAARLDGPSLLVASTPGDPDLVPAALVQLAAAEDGWRVEWAGRPALADLDEELAARPVRAVVVFLGVRETPAEARRLVAGLESLAARRGTSLGLVGLGDRELAPAAAARLDSPAATQAWLDGLRARLDAPPPQRPHPAPTAAIAELRWDPALALGHAVLDAQHETLFTHVGAFLAAVRGGAPLPDLPEFLGFVADYTALHFRTEEHLMREVAYPGLAEHLLEHQALSSRLPALVAALGDPPARPALEALAGFLAGWLQGHVAGSDQRIARHLRAGGA